MTKPACEDPEVVCLTETGFKSKSMVKSSCLLIKELKTCLIYITSQMTFSVNYKKNSTHHFDSRTGMEETGFIKGKRENLIVKSLESSLWQFCILSATLSTDVFQIC